MEPPLPRYMAPNLLELPHAIIIDLANELLPIMNLMVEFSPLYSQRDYEKTLHMLFAAIVDKNDIDYRIAEFSTTVMEDFILPYNKARYTPVSEHRLHDISLLLVNAARSVYNRINSMSGYVSGIFPYTVSDIRLNCEVYLKNTAYLNYQVELNRKPFLFH